MITIPDAMRRPAEVERDELKKQLADARAEVDRIKSDFITTICNLDVDIADKNAEIDRKDALIKQMQSLIMSEICKPCATMRCNICKFQAALAAERGKYEQDTEN